MSSVSTDSVIALKAISAWVDVIDSNIGGSTRTAYKASRVSFTKNNPPTTLSTDPTQRIQIPTAALDIAYLPIDFSQGELNKSTEDTHMALLGEGYFLTSDSLDYIKRDTLLTRDGEFHWDAQGYLRSTNGLYVMDESGVTQQSASDQAVPIYTDPATQTTFSDRWRLRVYNPDDLMMPANVRTDFEIDLQALIDAGKLQGDLDDLRVTYWDGRQNNVLPIQVDTTAGLQNAVISFRTPTTVAVGDYLDDVYLNFGNPSAGTGPLTVFGTVPAAADDFNDAADSTIPPARANWAAPTGPGVWVVKNAARGPTGDGDTDRELVQTANTGTEARIEYDDGSSYTWEDYRFSVTVGNNDSDDDAVYVYFRYQDPNNWYRLQISTGGVGLPTRKIQKSVGGVITTLVGDNYVPAGGTTSPSPPWREQVDVEVRGNRIRIFQSGVVALETYDTNPILQGTIALGNYSQGAWYDDMSVVAMPPIGTVVASKNGAIVQTGVGTALAGVSEQTFLTQAIGIVRPASQDGLQFSKYGSTVFDATNSPAAGRLQIGFASDGQAADIKFGYLETSNASIVEYIPTLASAQKMFAAISKVITAFNGTLDDMNNLVR